MSERPAAIEINPEGRPHCETGPAIAFRDGWRLYYYRGMAVPEAIIEQRDSMKISQIDRQRNLELRRVMIELYGRARYIADSGAVEIHRDRFGVLYKKAQRDDHPIVMVKVINSTPEPDGSRKEYFLRVPPHMESARQAVAWTFRMDKDEYCPGVES